MKYLILIVFFFACAPRTVETLGFNNINYGKVAYVAKVGNNLTAQVGNPARPFADPWAALAQVDSGYLVKFLDSGLYTFGSVGSGAEFEHDSTTSGGFDLAKDGVVVDFNGATLKYKKHPSVKKVVYQLFKIDSFDVINISDLCLDMTEMDTVGSPSYRGVIERPGYMSTAIFRFKEILLPNSLIGDYSIINAFPERKKEFDITIDRLIGANCAMWMWGFDKIIVHIGLLDAGWSFFESQSTPSIVSNAAVYIDNCSGRLAPSVNGSIMDLHVKNWFYDSGNPYIFYNYPFYSWVDTLHGVPGQLTFSLSNCRMDADTIDADGAIFDFNVRASSVAHFKVNGLSVGTTSKPGIYKRGTGKLYISGYFNGSKSCHFAGGSVDLSNFTYVTTDTTSTRAASATTVMCQGFRSNKAMSSVNTTKVGTEFINASIF